MNLLVKKFIVLAVLKDRLFQTTSTKNFTVLTILKDRLFQTTTSNKFIVLDNGKIEIIYFVVKINELIYVPCSIPSPMLQVQ
jgi:ABC-type sulfate/molybdate transport systems ATPase subunit